MGLDDYSDFLHDTVRIDAYRRAIEQTVEPGHVVCDVGAGLGTYSYFACRAGAQRVFAIENSVFDALEVVAQRQGFGERLRLLRGNSQDVEPEERADVIIFEDFSSTLLGSGLAPMIRDAHARLLSPGGTWIPQRGELWAALVEAQELWESVAAWRAGHTHLPGLDFAPLSDWLLNQSCQQSFSAGDLVTPGRMLKDFHFGDPREEYVLSWEGRDETRRAGVIHGICSWFRLVLCPDVILDNAPGTDGTVYGHYFFPLPHKLPVAENASVSWSLQCLAEGGGEKIWWKWKVGTDEASSEGSTFSAFPLSRVELEKRSAGHVPRLTKFERHLRFVLNAVDGGLDQGEIAKKLRAEFPDDFPEGQKALEFVVQSLG